jgi:hypothetical protein
MYSLLTINPWKLSLLSTPVGLFFHFKIKVTDDALDNYIIQIWHLKNNAIAV